MKTQAKKTQAQAPTLAIAPAAPTNEKRDLLTTENAKTSKGEDLGYLTGILYLAPANESGKNTCPFASVGCTAACLFTSGRGAFDKVRAARLEKTRYLWQSVKCFVDNLETNIQAL